MVDQKVVEDNKKENQKLPSTSSLTQGIANKVVTQVQTLKLTLRSSKVVDIMEFPVVLFDVVPQ